jgi:hypothetical protein
MELEDIENAMTTEQIVDDLARQLGHVAEPQEQNDCLGLLIPRDAFYPEDAVQCDECGGTGHDCSICGGKGWLPGKQHPGGRRCEYCKKPLHPARVQVYCSNRCALDDA